MRWFSTVGLAAAGTAAVLVQAWYLQSRLTRRLPGLGFGPLWPNLVKITIASAVMGVVVWAGWRASAWLPVAGRARDLIVVLGLIPAGAAIYGLLLWALRIEGRTELEAILNRVCGRREPPADPAP
jgi:putative peptidoglycan lipid II flippase